MALCTSLVDFTATTAEGVELSNRLLKRFFAAAYSVLDGRMTWPSMALSKAFQSGGPDAVGGRCLPGVAGGACGSGSVARHEPNSAPAAAVPSAPRMNA
jgi:hypothetical protein